MNTTRRNRLTLIIIFLLFFMPVIAAVLLQSNWVQYEPDRTVNRGTLIEPPLPINVGALTLSKGFSDFESVAGRWLVLHMVADICDPSCVETVTDIRQIHIATGRHMDEVSLLVHSQGNVQDQLIEIYDRLMVAQSNDPEFVSTLVRITGQTESAVPESPPDHHLWGATFIADPEGNLILRYEPGYDPDDLKTDLEKLLTWSVR